jgi:hypothetical protein
LTRKSASLKPLAFSLLALIALALGACSAPKYGASTLAGKAAILDQINYALTAKDCTTAINLAEGLYDSPYTDNQVRYARAAAQGCNAQVFFFNMVDDLANNSVVGSDLWRTLAKLFPSTTTDSRAESAWYATDALMAILKLGTVISTSAKINVDTPNPGSLVAANREDDANLYLMMVSMASIGALENRYSAPDSSYNPTQVLGYKASATEGWENAENIDEEGCAFAASVLTLMDSIGEIAPKLSGEMGATMSDLVSDFQSGLDAACSAGCTTALLTGCALPAGSCDTCPLTLRNRKSCTGLTTDENSCAAAGIAYFVDNPLNPVGWHP